MIHERARDNNDQTLSVHLAAACAAGPAFKFWRALGCNREQKSSALFVVGRIEVVDPHRPRRRPQSHAGRTTIRKFDAGPLERPLDRVAHGTMNGFFLLEIMYDSDVNAGRNRNSSRIPIEQAARGPALRWYHGSILTTVDRIGQRSQSGGTPMMAPITTTVFLSVIYV
jgi:hypothetical protein